MHLNYAILHSSFHFTIYYPDGFSQRASNSFLHQEWNRLISV